MKNKFVYHGSRKEIIGDKLEPRRANGLGEKIDEKQTGVYSTDRKDAAIVMGIISGAKLSSMYFYRGKARGIIYEGWPKREKVYLYYLPKEKFEKIKGDNWQWISYNAIKPIKIEKLYVKNYVHLIRKATNKERENFLTKHKKELNKLNEK